MSQQMEAAATVQRVRFSRDAVFHEDVRRKVEEYFRSTGQRPRDCRSMYIKSILVLAAFLGSYSLLAFVAHSWWQVALLVPLVGLSAAAIGLNIQHDGGHRAFSDRPWVNRLAALTLDLIGGSSYLWHVKHSVLHHTYTNVVGHDSDIDVGSMGRLAPHQRHMAIHRWQHYYMWLLYGFMTIRWQLLKDFMELSTGRIRTHRFPPPRGWDLVKLIGGKVVFLSVAFFIPMLLHPVGLVLLCYAGAGLTMGIALSLIFQVAHCVDDASFPLPETATGLIDRPWAILQVESTVDFARKSRLATWLLGGLNYQVEHHLFPRVCHVHYPAISKIVEGACRDSGVRYREHTSFWTGVAAHFRFLRRLAAPGTSG
jgi:linoleoyl-CoA desaturase